MHHPEINGVSHPLKITVTSGFPGNDKGRVLFCFGLGSSLLEVLSFTFPITMFFLYTIYDFEFMIDEVRVIKQCEVGYTTFCLSLVTV